MKFFLLTNPNSLLNTSGHSYDHPHGFPPIIGQSDMCRRRSPKSKNCENNRKDAKKRRRQAKAAAAKLQDEISQLDRQLALMNDRQVSVRQNSQDTAYNIMEMYFRHIVRGINPAKFPAQAQATKSYLASVFAHDIKIPDYTIYTGLDQFIHQWQLLSEYHTDTECQASSIEVYPLYDEEIAQEDEQSESFVNVVRAYGTTTMQISRTTIERVFPHILSDETLVQWLIGKKYSFSFQLSAYVDIGSGRVVQIESTVDLTSALLELLQDPFVTIKMVESTTMSKHGNLLLTQDVHENE